METIKKFIAVVLVLCIFAALFSIGIIVIFVAIGIGAAIFIYRKFKDKTDTATSAQPNNSDFSVEKTIEAQYEIIEEEKK